MTIGIKWYFIIYISNGIYFISNNKCQINFMKFAIKENSELF